MMPPLTSAFARSTRCFSWLATRSPADAFVAFDTITIHKFVLVRTNGTATTADALDLMGIDQRAVDGVAARIGEAAHRAAGR
jgi:hypothetical protein